MADWDTRFLRMAKETATWSKDPSTQVGCVLVRPDKTIASLGFNGFPKGMFDNKELYEDREEKYSRILHAEENAVLNAGESLAGYTAYVTAPPCTHCACVLIQSGIDRIVYIKPSPALLERWKEHFIKARVFYSEARVIVSEHDDVD